MKKTAGIVFVVMATFVCMVVFTPVPSAQTPAAKPEKVFLSISPSGPGSSSYAMAVAHTHLVNN